MQSNQGSPTDNTPRHWRGIPGNRHEHTNVWVVGGRPQPYRPETTRPETTTTSMSSATTTDPVTNTMNIRRESDASITSGTSTGTNTAATNTNANTTNVGGRRRSSASGSPSLFYSLANQKRNSQDPTMAERRASWTEQMQKGGVFAQWWNGYTRGS